MSIPIIKDLKDRYRTNKDNIPSEYREFFAEYLNNINQLNEDEISEGNRKYTYNCYKPVLINFLEKHGFNVFDEVNLYNPEEKVKILRNGIVKNSLSELKKFKPKKSIDLVAVRENGLKKIIFIEVKMCSSSDFLLSGLFELGMIDKEKISDEYDVHFVLLSAFSDHPPKYGGLFDVYKKMFMLPPDWDNCQFVLLDPKNCFNETKFCNEILS